MPPDPKTDAQQALSKSKSRCPVGLYMHRKGGAYIVFAHSLKEDTLDPLVHYWSIERRTVWTRTIADFIEVVEERPRFMRVRDVSAFDILDVVRELVRNS
jgi:hypothetical protein